MSVADFIDNLKHEAQLTKQEIKNKISDIKTAAGDKLEEKFETYGNVIENVSDNLYALNKDIAKSAWSEPIDITRDREKHILYDDKPQLGKLLITIGFMTIVCAAEKGLKGLNALRYMKYVPSLIRYGWEATDIRMMIKDIPEE